MSTELMAPKGPMQSLFAMSMEMGAALELWESAQQELADAEQSGPPSARADRVAAAGETVMQAEQHILSLVTAQAASVDSVHSLYRWLKTQIEAAEREEERIYRIKRSLEAAIEAVKAGSMAALQAANQRSFEGTGKRKIRRQANGPLSLDVTDATKVPDQYVDVTLRVDLLTWKSVKEIMEHHHSEALASLFKQQGDSEISTSRIKDAAIACPACDGTKETVEITTNTVIATKCEQCGGIGKVSSVPGTVLRRGEHVRFS